MKTTDELPLDIREDYLWSSVLKALDKEIQMWSEYVTQGVRDPVDYHRACGKLAGVKWAKAKMIELARNEYKESEEN
jgi:hypothetical protein